MPNKPSQRSPRPTAPDTPARVPIRVQPKSSRNQVRVDPDGRILVYVTAPPADGAANTAVCKVLADALGVSKSSVRIVHGDRGRDKHVSIEGLSLESVLQRLSAVCE